MFLKSKNKIGYTLIEICIVLIVLGVLASIAFPQFYISVERTKAAEGVNILENIFNAEQHWALDHNNTFTNDISNLDVSYTIFGHFNPIIVSDFADPLPALGANSELVRIRRNETTPFNYTLHITATGVISCSGGGGSICTKIGY